MIKKIFTVMITLVMFFSGFSLMNISADIEQTQNDSYFQEFVTPVFKKDSSYNVYNKVGEEVTNTFLSETTKFYEKQDFEKIQNYLASNEYYLTRVKFTPISNRAVNGGIRSTWYTKEYLNYVDMTNGSGYSIPDVMICYMIKCHVSMDYSGNIVSQGTPSVTPTSGKPGWYVDEVSTRASHSGKYLDVYASFRACWNLFRSDKKITVNIHTIP